MQDVVEQRVSGVQATPAWRQVKDQTSASTAEDRAAGQDLGTDGGRFAITR